MARLIIAGSRGFDDFARLSEEVDRFCLRQSIKVVEVVSGGARGADRLGERWANELSIKVTRFPAQWATYGKSAGMVRNRRMAEYATHLIAFWDGSSRGTQNMIEVARKQGLEVLVVAYGQGE